MLSVFTDLKNPVWLNYILEEFKSISGAQFEISVNNLSNFNNQDTSNNALVYASRPVNEAPFIPQKDQIVPNNNFSWLNDGFYILSGSDYRSNLNQAINYDLFWNAFVHLSRLEEWNSENEGTYIRSYALRHPRKDKTTFDIPIVNYYFEDLKQFISRTFPQLRFEKPKTPSIEWSHDLDYIQKTIQLRLKQTAFNGFNTLKSLLTKNFSSNLNRTISFLFSNPSYWCFDYWTELEKQHNVRSVFYIYAKHNEQRKDGRRVKSWLIDPSYDIKTNRVLQDKLKLLNEEGFTIGLHGSYNSATDSELLELEKCTLENSLDIKITKTRQHWLNYTEQHTPTAHNLLFKEDSTVGWNDRPGFRAGCASVYHPFDHKKQKPFTFEVVPQIIMDSHVFDYGFSRSKTQSILNKFLELHNAKASISWHPRTCNSDYNWGKTYEELMKQFTQKIL